jgi:hypothetical protein
MSAKAGGEFSIDDRRAGDAETVSRHGATIEAALTWAERHG